MPHASIMLPSCVHCLPRQLCQIQIRLRGCLHRFKERLQQHRLVRTRYYSCCSRMLSTSIDLHVAFRLSTAYEEAFHMSNQDTVVTDSRSLGLTNRIDAVLFDRDGVLTYFDVDAATAFFRPLLPISLAEIAGRWRVLGAAVGFPRHLGEERLLWACFWDQLSDEFQLTAEQRAALGSLDYAFCRAVPRSRFNSRTTTRKQDSAWCPIQFLFGESRTIIGDS